MLELADQAAPGPNSAGTVEGSSPIVLQASPGEGGIDRGIPSRPSIDPEVYEPRTLRSQMKGGGRLPIDECVEISQGLTKALSHLHHHGLVHRDIKPPNIIFVNGRPKLADIGLVAKADATLSFVGTESYLPPECPGKPPADIYSLGEGDL